MHFEVWMFKGRAKHKIKLEYNSDLLDIHVFYWEVSVSTKYWLSDFNSAYLLSQVLKPLMDVFLLFTTSCCEPLLKPICGHLPLVAYRLKISIPVSWTLTEHLSTT